MCKNFYCNCFGCLQLPFSIWIYFACVIQEFLFTVFGLCYDILRREREVLFSWEKASHKKSPRTACSGIKVTCEVNTGIHMSWLWLEPKFSKALSKERWKMVFVGKPAAGCGAHMGPSKERCIRTNGKCWTWPPVSSNSFIPACEELHW